jgi:selenide,water dikinase
VKYGLAVTGRVHPARLLTNAGARAGDRLVLTKPLGSGILATAAKRSPLEPDIERALIATMTMLNRNASAAALAVGSRCATDITGFGLLGHASHIARASNVTLRIDADAVPVLPGTLEAWTAGATTGGAERNATYLETLVEWGALPDSTRAILFDPQTSGGLLIAVSVDKVASLFAAVPGAVEIGEVLPRGASALVVT